MSNKSEQEGKSKGRSARREADQTDTRRTKGVCRRVCGVWCRAELCSLTQARTRAFLSVLQTFHSLVHTHTPDTKITHGPDDQAWSEKHTDGSRPRKGKKLHPAAGKKKILREGVWETDPGRYRSVLPHSNNKLQAIKPRPSTTLTRAAEPERALPYLLQLPDLRLHHWRSQLPRTTYRPEPMASGRSSGGAGTGAV